MYSSGQEAGEEGEVPLVDEPVGGLRMKNGPAMSTPHLPKTRAPSEGNLTLGSGDIFGMIGFDDK